MNRPTIEQILNERKPVDHVREKENEKYDRIHRDVANFNKTYRTIMKLKANGVKLTRDQQSQFYEFTVSRRNYFKERLKDVDRNKLYFFDARNYNEDVHLFNKNLQMRHYILEYRHEKELLKHAFKALQMKVHMNKFSETLARIACMPPNNVLKCGGIEWQLFNEEIENF